MHFAKLFEGNAKTISMKQEINLSKHTKTISACVHNFQLTLQKLASDVVRWVFYRGCKQTSSEISCIQGEIVKASSGDNKEPY